MGLHRLIFLVDDNEVDCLIAKMLIEKAYPNSLVNSFFSVESALEALQFRVLYNKEELPELILLDLEMPIKDGWDFLGQYQKLISDTPFKLPSVYVLTASIDPKDIVKTKGYYPFVEAFLVKPLTKENIALITHNHYIA